MAKEKVESQFAFTFPTLCIIFIFAILWYLFWLRIPVGDGEVETIDEGDGSEGYKGDVSGDESERRVVPVVEGRSGEKKWERLDLGELRKE